MKGGKGGRKRTSNAGVGGAAAGRRPTGHGGGAPAKGNARRPSAVAPKKGSRKKPHFGGTSAAGDE